MCANTVTLTGEIAAIQSLRHSPAGVAIVRFTLRHRSQQHEAGMTRQTAFEVSAFAAGEVAQSAARFETGAPVTVQGFLAGRSHKGAQVGTQLVLHVTHIERLS